MSPETFRVYPQHPWRFDVLVFSSERPMYAYAQAAWDYPSRDWAACVFTGDVGRSRTRCLGEILFHRRSLTPEIVSHEATHAAHNYYTLRSGRKSIYISPNGTTSPSEEIIAGLQADIAAQIMRELTKRGLIR